MNTHDQTPAEVGAKASETMPNGDPIVDYDEYSDMSYAECKRHGNYSVDSVIGCQECFAISESV